MLLLSLAACSVKTGGKSNVDNYPTKQITYSIPFNPGGQSDVAARRQQPYLKKELGVPVVIQYKPGGGGSLGWSDLVKEKPNGYFISGINLPHIILQPLLRKNAGFKTDQIQPIAIFQATPIGLAVPKSSGITTLKQFIAKAKAKPGSITVAGSGTYSGHQMAFFELQQLAGIKMQYIPFTGAAPEVKAFLGGQTDAIFANSSDLVTYKDKMNILAIGSDKTFQPLPNVKTFKEQGIDMTAGIDRGVGVPKGTDPKIVSKLEKAFLDIVTKPSIKQEMYKEGLEPKALGVKESEAYIKKKEDMYMPILKKLGLIKSSK